MAWGDPQSDLDAANAAADAAGGGWGGAPGPAGGGGGTWGGDWGSALSGGDVGATGSGYGGMSAGSSGYGGPSTAGGGLGGGPAMGAGAVGGVGAGTSSPAASASPAGPSIGASAVGGVGSGVSAGPAYGGGIAGAVGSSYGGLGASGAGDLGAPSSVGPSSGYGGGYGNYGGYQGAGPGSEGNYGGPTGYGGGGPLSGGINGGFQGNAIGSAGQYDGGSVGGGSVGGPAMGSPFGGYGGYNPASSPFGSGGTVSPGRSMLASIASGAAVGGPAMGSPFGGYGGYDPMSGAGPGLMGGYTTATDATNYNSAAPTGTPLGTLGDWQGPLQPEAQPSGQYLANRQMQLDQQPGLARNPFDVSPQPPSPLSGATASLADVAQAAPTSGWAATGSINALQPGMTPLQGALAYGQPALGPLSPVPSPTGPQPGAAPFQNLNDLATASIMATGVDPTKATFQQAAYAADKAFGFPEGTIGRQLMQESGYNPNAVNAGSIYGMSQMSDKARKAAGVTNKEDPMQQIFGGARYLGQQLPGRQAPVFEGTRTQTFSGVAPGFVPGLGSITTDQRNRAYASYFGGPNAVSRLGWSGHPVDRYGNPIKGSSTLGGYVQAVNAQNPHYSQPVSLAGAQPVTGGTNIPAVTGPPTNATVANTGSYASRGDYGNTIPQATPDLTQANPVPSPTQAPVRDPTTGQLVDPTTGQPVASPNIAAITTTPTSVPGLLAGTAMQPVQAAPTQAPVRDPTTGQLVDPTTGQPVASPPATQPIEPTGLLDPAAAARRGLVPGTAPAPASLPPAETVPSQDLPYGIGVGVDPTTGMPNEQAPPLGLTNAWAAPAPAPTPPIDINHLLQMAGTSPYRTAPNTLPSGYPPTAPNLPAPQMQTREPLPPQPDISRPIQPTTPQPTPAIRPDQMVPDEAPITPTQRIMETLTQPKTGQKPLTQSQLEQLTQPGLSAPGLPAGLLSNRGGGGQWPYNIDATASGGGGGGDGGRTKTKPKTKAQKLADLRKRRRRGLSDVAARQPAGLLA